MVIKCDFPECDKKAMINVEAYLTPDEDEMEYFDFCEEHYEMTFDKFKH